MAVTKCVGEESSCVIGVYVLAGGNKWEGPAAAGKRKQRKLPRTVRVRAIRECDHVSFAFLQFL